MVPSNPGIRGRLADRASRGLRNVRLGTHVVALEARPCLHQTVLFRLVRAEDFGGASGGSSLEVKLLCEFIGTFMLVVTVGFNVLSGSAA